MNDPISDLITRIRNAKMSGAVSVSATYSKMKEAVLKVMLAEHYVKSYDVKSNKSRKILRIDISDNKISHIRRISKPGHRIYSKHTQIPKPLRGFGLVIVSTPKGVISGKVAKRES
ncbi:30S ribosomal protein S8, partial [Candidatus Berkelbacteria bacterium RIFOXYA2_FULL_43_10]